MSTPHSLSDAQRARLADALDLLFDELNPLLEDPSRLNFATIADLRDAVWLVNDSCCDPDFGGWFAHLNPIDHANLADRSQKLQQALVLQTIHAQVSNDILKSCNKLNELRLIPIAKIIALLTHASYLTLPRRLDQLCDKIYGETYSLRRILDRISEEENGDGEPPIDGDESVFCYLDENGVLREVEDAKDAEEHKTKSDELT